MGINMEEEAYELIKRAGEKGILQSELWKILKTNSREGSRIAARLEKKGQIRREKVLYKGRWTYKLIPIKTETKEVQWTTLNGCPCFTCPNIRECKLGSAITPANCKELTNWILKLIKKNSNEINQ